MFLHGGITFTCIAFYVKENKVQIWPMLRQDAVSFREKLDEKITHQKCDVNIWSKHTQNLAICYLLVTDVHTLFFSKWEQKIKARFNNNRPFWGNNISNNNNKHLVNAITSQINELTNARGRRKRRGLLGACLRGDPPVTSGFVGEWRMAKSAMSVVKRIAAHLWEKRSIERPTQHIEKIRWKRAQETGAKRGQK